VDPLPVLGEEKGAGNSFCTSYSVEDGSGKVFEGTEKRTGEISLLTR
jgi:hypothetical protein